MKKLLLLTLALTAIHATGKTYFVTDFGAVGDGVTVNTKAIQNAIDTCSETKGELIFPSGDYVTGTLFLKSNVHIILKEGAILYGSTNLEDYPFIEHKFPTSVHQYADHALIYANSVENFGISGGGRIDGNGPHPNFSLLRESPKRMHRPYMIQFINCKNVRMQGIELHNPSFWLHHYVNCEDLFIDGLQINSHSAPNNDGLDIDDCRNVVVSNCVIYCEDDGLCFKSTTPYGTQNVSVSNCIVRTSCNGIKLGTDSMNGFEDINFSNIVINQAHEAEETFFGTRHGICGIAVEAVDGGDINNINFTNITINDYDTPIYIKLGDRLRKPTPESPDPEVGVCSNITFSNLTISGFTEYASNITGMPGYYVENIIFDNITYVTKGFTGFDPNDMLDVPEKSKNYPSPEIYGVFPAHSFYVRHAKNITFSNIQCSTQGKDSRHAFVFDDVHGFRVSDSDFSSEGNPSVIRVINSTDGMIASNLLQSPVEAFVKIDGKASDGIMIQGNHARRAKQLVEKEIGVSDKAVFKANNWE